MALNRLDLNAIRENIYTFEKFTREQWESIERPVDSGTLEILKLLVNTGYSERLEVRIKACGELAYLHFIRPQLVKRHYLQNDPNGPALLSLDSLLVDSSKGKGKGHGHSQGHNGGKGKKEAKVVIKRDDIIRLQNFQKIIHRATDELFTMFETSREQAVPQGLSKDILELRVVTLITLAYFVSQNLEGADRDIELGYRTVMSIQLVLENINQQNYTSVLNSIESIPVSSTIVNDLTVVHAKLKQALQFRVETLFNMYPHLVDPSCFYSVLPQFSIKLNSCQKQLIEISREQRSFLIFYASNFGSGKTTATIGIAAARSQVRDHLTIYCCMSEAVRHNLAKCAYSAQIPFALAVNVNGQVRIINNRNCRDQRARKLIITDYLTAYDLLSRTDELLPCQMPSNMTLIVDEPTDGADQRLHFKTTVFAHLFQHAPCRTILVSATLPSNEELKPYLDYFDQKWSHLKPYHTTVRSNKVRIGCQLVERSGESFVLHSVCSSCQDLERLVELLKTNQFLGRLYTPFLVYELHRKVKQVAVTATATATANANANVNLSNLPDLEKCFTEVSMMNTENVKNVAIQILELLHATGNDELVREVCQMRVPARSRYDLYGKTNAAKVTFDFDFNLLGTEHAHKFIGPTLLVTATPKQAIDRYFSKLLEGENADRLIDNYQRNREAEDRAFKKYEKSMNAAASAKPPSSRDRTGPKQSETQTALEQQKELDEMLEGLESDISFPPYKQINTYRHVRFYTKALNFNHDEFNGRKLRMPALLTNLPYDANVSRDLILRLFSGVGLLTSQGVDASYNNTIVSQTLEGLLAYTVSDETIIFGVNAPADNLIIEDSAIEKRSISTIFQLLARVGRPGRSTSAYAYIGPILKDILTGYLTKGRLGCLPLDNEAENMNLALKMVLNPLEAETILKQILSIDLATDIAPTTTPVPETLLTEAAVVVADDMAWKPFTLNEKEVSEPCELSDVNVNVNASMVKTTDSDNNDQQTTQPDVGLSASASADPNATVVDATFVKVDGNSTDLFEISAKFKRQTQTKRTKKQQLCEGGSSKIDLGDGQCVTLNTGSVIINSNRLRPVVNKELPPSWGRSDQNRGDREYSSKSFTPMIDRSQFSRGGEQFSRGSGGGDGQYQIREPVAPLTRDQMGTETTQRHQRETPQIERSFLSRETTNTNRSTSTLNRDSMGTDANQPKREGNAYIPPSSKTVFSRETFGGDMPPSLPSKSFRK